MVRTRWILLDRDGTINRSASESGYIIRTAQVELLPRAGDAIARLNRAGLPVTVVTNQRGVALGLMSEADLDTVNSTLCELLARAGAHLDAVLSCTHHKDSCDCRKPLTGLLERAASIVGMPLDHAVIVGDSETDIEAGRRAGTQTIRLGDEGTPTDAGLLVPTLWDAVDAILAGA
jgi:D-glycero-D-manno-heptose 1,7-bisphosphate phosphatase